MLSFFSGVLAAGTTRRRLWRAAKEASMRLPTSHPRRIPFMILCVFVLSSVSVGLSLDMGLPAQAQSVVSTAAPLREAREGRMNTHDAAVRLGAVAEDPTEKLTFLPVVLRSASQGVHGGIYGWVSYYGTPPASVPLALRFYNGTAWSTAATTTSSGDTGYYMFINVPTLQSGQRYYVRFGPNITDSQYLASWHGPLITSHAAENSQAGGDFDIANVFLDSPGSGSLVSLPAQFLWLRRELGSESYRWVLWDCPPSGTGTSLWTSSDLGDVDNFTLDALPTGYTADEVYCWYVQVYAGPDSYGTSFYYREVTFQQGSATRSASRPVPQRGPGPSDIGDAGPALEPPKR
jgi:hypothetical protein